MHTQFFAHINGPSDPRISDAAEIIRSGGLVAFPTETVYGLGANALDPDAVRRIFSAKGRPADNPLIAHISEFEEIRRLVSALPPEAELLAEKFWPGPLTIILPVAPSVPKEVTAGLPTVGVRLPANDIARALIKESGVPIAAPSANSSGKPSPTTAMHVYDDMCGRIEAVLDGGRSGVGVESTIVSLAGGTPKLLRPGGISLEQLESLLGKVEVDKAVREKLGDNEKPLAPGMKYRHYAPKAPMTLVVGDPEKTIKRIMELAGPNDGVICFDEYFFRVTGTPYVRGFGHSSHPEEQAKRLFRILRSFDCLPVEQIYSQCPEEKGIGLAVANRLKKAAGFSIISVD